MEAQSCKPNPLNHPALSASEIDQGTRLEGGVGIQQCGGEKAEQGQQMEASHDCGRTYPVVHRRRSAMHEVQMQASGRVQK